LDRTLAEVTGDGEGITGIFTITVDVTSIKDFSSKITDT